jgi:hypothetical protein
MPSSQAPSSRVNPVTAGGNGIYRAVSFPERTQPPPNPPTLNWLSSRSLQPDPCRSCDNPDL